MVAAPLVGSQCVSPGGRPAGRSHRGVDLLAAPPAAGPAGAARRRGACRLRPRLPDPLPQPARRALHAGNLERRGPGRGDRSALRVAASSSAFRWWPRQLRGRARRDRADRGPRHAPAGDRDLDPAARRRRGLALLLGDHPLPPVPRGLHPDLPHGALDDGRPLRGGLHRGALAPPLGAGRERRRCSPCAGS